MLSCSYRIFSRRHFACDSGTYPSPSMHVRALQRFLQCTCHVHLPTAAECTLCDRSTGHLPSAAASYHRQQLVAAVCIAAVRQRYCGCPFPMLQGMLADVPLSARSHSPSASIVLCLWLQNHAGELQACWLMSLLTIQGLVSCGSHSLCGGMAESFAKRGHIASPPFPCSCLLWAPQTLFLIYAAAVCVLLVAVVQLIV